MQSIREVLRTNRLLSFDDTDRTENDASNNSSLPLESLYRLPSNDTCQVL
jgi:hypothetical protein